MAGSDFQKVIRFVFDSGPVASAFEKVDGRASALTRSVADLQKQLDAVRNAASKITTPKGLEQMAQLTSKATAGIQGTTQAMAAQLRAMREEDAADRQGAAAKAQLIRQRTELAALVRAGTTATTAEGQTIRANLAAQEQMAKAIAGITAARQQAARTADAQAAAEERLRRSLAELRAENAQAGRNVAAASAGPGAMAEENRQLAVRNALLASGVATISDQGRLVVTNIEGARAIEQQVLALKRQEAALAEVRTRLRELGSATETAAAAQSQFDRQASAGVTLTREGAQASIAKLAALREEDAAKLAGAEAEALLNRQRAESAALSAAGVTAESSRGRAIIANLGVTEKMNALIAETVAKRKADAKAAAEQESAQKKLDASLKGYRAQTVTASRTAAATASGPGAVAALNQQLAVENALLASGAAEINAQGKLVVINEANAASVRQVVGALQQEQAALARVQAEAAAMGSKGAASAGLFARAIGEIGQALKFTIVYGSIFAAASLFADGIRQATEFKTVLVQIQTLAGESAAQTRQWNADLLAMAPAVGRGPVELAKAMYQVTSTGQHGAVALDIVRKSAEASAIGLGDTAVIARTVTGALNAYGEANLSAANATDTLVAMVKLGGGEADAFAGSLGRVLPVAAGVGVSFQQVGAFLATFTRLGVSAEEAVTALRGTLGALGLQNTKQGRDTLKAFGTSYAELRKEIADKGLAQALVDLNDRFKGNIDAFERVIPNIRAFTGVLAVAKSQQEQFLAVNKEIQESLGHVRKEAFDLTKTDPGFVFSQMRAQAQAFAIALGGSLMPQLVEVAKGIQSAFANADMAKWSAVIGGAFSVVVTAGKAAALILGNLPIVLGAYAISAVGASAGTLTLAASFEAAEAGAASLTAAIAANPVGAIAVVAAAAAIALKSMADASRAANQAFLDEVALANQDAVVIAKLRDEYDLLTVSKEKYYRVEKKSGVGAEVGAGEIVLKTDSDHFLGQMAAVEEAYKKKIAAAGGDKVAVDAAKIARDRDTAALQSNTQAMIANTQAAIENEKARDQASLSAAQDKLKTASQALAAIPQNKWIGPARLLFGENAPDDEVVAKKRARLKEEARLAQEEVRRLDMEAHSHEKLAERRVAALAKIQEAVDRTRASATAAGGDGGTPPKVPVSGKADNALADIKASIALKQLEARATAELAQAELRGGLAVRQVTIAKEQDKAVEEARLRAEKGKIAFDEKWATQIRASIQAQHDATLEQKRNAAAYAASIAVTNDARQAAAYLTDAWNGNTNASRVLGATFRAEAEAYGQLKVEMKDGKLQLDEQGRADVALAEKQERLKISTEARAKAISDSRAADIRAQQAAAALTDAVNDNSAATNKLTGDIAADNAARAAGDALSPKEIANLRARARFSEDLARKKKIETEQEKALADVRRETAQDVARLGAGSLDLRQQAAAAAQYGEATAQVLSQFGLLNDASRQLAIHERARAIAGKDADADRIAAIEAQLTGQDALLRQAQQAAAAEVIAAQKAKAFGDVAKGAVDGLKGALIDAAVDGSADFDQLAKNIEKSLLETIWNVVAEFVRGEAVKQAAAARTAAIQGASGVAGGSSTAGQGASQLLSGVATSGSSGSSGFGGISAAGWAAGIFAVAALVVNNYSRNMPRTWGSFDVGSPQYLPNRYGYGNSPTGINTSAAVGGYGNLAAMQARADAFVKALRDMVNGIGATLDDLAKIGVKKAGRGGNTHWRVYDASGKMLKDFGTDETAAMNFALITALKSATLGNASPLVKAGIQSSTATTADQLKSDLDFLRNLERSVMNEGEAWATQRLEQLRAERDRLQELVGATTEFGNAVRMLDAAYAKDVAARRNAALGIAETEQQRIARQSEEFNQQLAAMRKPLEDELAALLASLGQALSGGGGGNPTNPTGGGYRPGNQQTPTNYEDLTGLMNRGDGASTALAGLTGALADLGNGALQSAAAMALAAAATGGSVDEIRQRIAELQALLQSAAFTPISPEEIARAGRDNGAAQARADALKSFRDKLAQLREAAGGEVAGIFGDLTRSIRDLKAEGKKAGASQAELAEGERLLREQAAKTIADRRASLLGTAPSEFAQGLRDGLKFFDDLLAKQRLAGKNLQVGGPDYAADRAAFLARQRESLTSTILDFAGLTDPMTAVNLKAAQMKVDLTALAAAGGISAEELARLTGVIDQGTAAARERAQVERDTANNNLLLQLYGFLSASHQNAALELSLKQRGVDLQFAVFKAQLIAAGIWEANMALFDQAHADALAALIAGAGDAAQAAADTQQGAADTQQQAAEQFAAATKSLLDAQRALRGGDAALSYLNPREQIASLQSHLEATIAAARGGSVEARGAVGQEILDFLRRNQETFGTGGAYQALARHYDDILTQLIGQTTFNVGNVAYGAFPGQNPAATTPVVYGGPAAGTGGASGDWTRVETAVSRVEGVEREISTILRTNGAMARTQASEMISKLDRIRALLEEIARDGSMNRAAA